MGMRASHVNKVHAALFGRRGAVASAVDKVDTVRLMLASVGVPFGVARDEEDDDEVNPDRLQSITWECFEEEWIGLNIREACGVPLEKDADWTPPADEPPSDDEHEYDDEDDEDGYGRYGRVDDCRHQ